MKMQKMGCVFLLVCVAAALVACGSDDNSPSSPSILSTVGGVWRFAGQLTQNACELDAYSPVTGDVTINQAGSIVNTPVVYLTIERGSRWYFTYAGTVSGSNVSMAAVDPYVFRSGSRVIHFGSGVDIRNVSNNVGSGTLNVTGSCIQGCTGNCQTIWSGTWTKIQ